MNLWVVVPVFNERKVLLSLLDRLKKIHQFEEFNVVFCDNNSTDTSRSFIETYAIEYELPWTIIEESEKGTGAAADTAIRAAIALGATHVARTDADCLPDLDWVTKIKQVFTTTDLLLVAGSITARTDDTSITEGQAQLFNRLVPLAAWFGKWRPLNRGKHFKGPYVMTAGCNLAIEANLYLECGGFPRTSIEDVHEDHVLMNAVRTVTSKYKYVPKVHVQVSARRIATWGVVNTLKWYANHSYKPEVVDIR